MTQEEKKQIYNTVMETASQIVIKKLIENDADVDIDNIIEEGWKEAVLAGALGLVSIFVSPETTYAKNLNNPGSSSKARTEYAVVDRAPQFPGGSDALCDFLTKNTKYPAEAEEIGVEGRVILSILIGKDGSIEKINVLRSADPLLTKEAVRVVKLMPKWIPGKKNGQAVREKFTVPFTFHLEKAE